MRIRPATGLAVVALLIAATAVGAPPPVFDDRPYENAKAAAAEAGKLFVVGFTAEWCRPCKQMDRTTWIDDDVVAWLDKHAVAVQIDVDKQPKIAQKYRVRAMPTIIAVKDGEEFDRVTGLKRSPELIGWLEGVERGDREIDALKKAARGAADGPIDIDARYKLAGELLRRGAFHDATEEYIWLWNNMLEHEPAMYGVRLSFMIGDIERLIQSHPAAGKRFAVLRDDLAKKLDAANRSTDDLMDFVALNKALGEQDRTLAWYDGAKDKPANRRAIDRIARDLEPMLLAEERWADLGRLAADPVEAVRSEIELQQLALRGGPPPEVAQQMREQSDRALRKKAAAYHAGCLAADREPEAMMVAAVALDHLGDPQTRIALVQTAVEAGEVRPVHAKWLDRAESDGAAAEAAALRPLVRAALGAAAAAPLFRDVAWIAGSWRAEPASGIWHEHWLPPEAGAMAGVLRWTDDQGVRLYELLAIERVVGADDEPRLELLIRHFNRGLTPWPSEADGPVRLPLQHADGARAVWAKDDLRITYTRQFSTAMIVTVESFDGAAWAEQARLNFERY